MKNNMNDNHLVSIVVPIYNVDKYLEETLKGLVLQTYNNLEINLVDDGSTDNSASICQMFVKKDSRFHYFFQENSGAPSARNKGIEHSNGEYLLLFDSDDILLPNAIELMVNRIEADNSDMVIGNYMIVKDEIESIRYTNIEKLICNVQDLFYVSPFPNNKLIRFNMIKDIRFDNVRIAQDANFFYKIIPFITKVSVLNDCVCKYRILDNSISSHCDSRVLDVIKSLQYVEIYYQDNMLSKIWFDLLRKSKIKHLINQIYKVVNNKTSRGKNEILKQLSKELHKTYLSIFPRIGWMQIKDYVYFIYLKFKYYFK